MKRTWPYILMVLLILAVGALAGCGEADLTKGKTAHEVLLASGETMKRINSYEFAMNMGLDMGSGSMVPFMSFAGVSEAEPPALAMTGSFSLFGQEMTLRMYLKGQKFYVLNPNDNVWLLYEGAAIPDDLLAMGPGTMLEGLENAVSAVYVNDANVDKTMKVIEATVTGQDLIDAVGGTLEGLATFDTMTLRAEISKKDLLIHRLVITVTGGDAGLGLTVNMEIDMRLSRFGEVTVTVPQEVINKAIPVTESGGL